MAAMPTPSQPTRAVVVHVELTPHAKEQIERLSQQRGMTQYAMLSRLAEWFANEDATVQGAVLGQYPRAVLADIAKMLVRRPSPHR
jgi:hypothetical protein